MLGTPPRQSTPFMTPQESPHTTPLGSPHTTPPEIPRDTHQGSFRHTSPEGTPLHIVVQNHFAMTNNFQVPFLASLNIHDLI